MGFPKYAGLIGQHRIRYGFEILENHYGFPIGKKDQGIGYRLDILHSLKIDKNFLMIKLRQQYHEDVPPQATKSRNAQVEVHPRWQINKAYGTVWVLFASMTSVKRTVLMQIDVLLSRAKEASIKFDRVWGFL